MLDDNLATVRVRTGWNSWRSADARISDLDDLHWSQPPGAPRPILHAFVTSDRLSTEGSSQLRVDCTTSHRVLVCVLKHDCVAAVYEQLARRAHDCASAPDHRLAMR